MSKVQSFEDLVIWLEAKELCLNIYRATNFMKDYGFKDQIQRASVSVMNNIAEGFERESDAEFRRFLFIAKASCGEVRSMLHLAAELNYLEKEKVLDLIQNTRKLSGSISNLIKYLTTHK